GALVATAPSHLDLGASSAQVEANTDLAWRRDGRDVRVEQRRGAATWSVAGGDTLEIVAGAVAGTGGDPHAPVAIRASGASLRVEVGMHPAEAKVLGASAIAAAAIGAVTVIVYDGTVAVTSAGQTVEVRPGGTVVARADRPPSPDDPAARTGDTDLDERRALRAAVDKLQAELETCSNGTAHAPTPVELVLDVVPEGKLELRRLTFDPLASPEGPTGASECISERIAAASFGKTRLGGRFQLNFQVAGACDPAAWSREPAKLESLAGQCKEEDHEKQAGCDDAALIAEGDASTTKGAASAALARYEAALACKATPSTLVKVGLAACEAREERRAREVFAKTSPDQQLALAKACLRQGIVLEAKLATAQAPGRTPAPAKVTFADADVERALRPLAKDLDTCHDGAFEGTVSLWGEVAPSGRVVSVSGAPRDERITRCVMDAVRKATFPAAPGGGSFQAKRPFKKHAAGCAPAQLTAHKAEGDLRIGRGEFTRALAAYDKILACGFDLDAFKKGFLAACRNRDRAKATEYKNLKPDVAQRYQEICLRNGIELFPDAARPR
ncbi:MAG: hypothetical protein KIT31_25475, partial [Deltaproteobacteria bacterium]|nr:hypothetical protein [Deltaproteobacteria bacterium]